MTRSTLVGYGFICENTFTVDFSETIIVEGKIFGAYG